MDKLGIAIDHDPDHGKEHPGVGAVEGSFVVADQAAMLNQPSEGPLDNPSLGKDAESGFRRDSLDDFDLGSRVEAPDPAGELRFAESPIGQNLFEPMTAENRSKKLLGSAAFGGVGRGNGHAQKPTQCIDTNEAFAPLGLFARIVTNQPAVRVGAHALAVDDPCGGLFVFALQSPQHLAQERNDALQHPRKRPASKVVVGGFPSRKIFWQHAPGTTTLENIENGVEHSPQARAGTSSSPRGGKKRREDMPLEVGDTGFVLVLSNFHRSKTAARKRSRRAQLPQSSSFYYLTPFSDSLKGSYALNVPRCSQGHLWRNSGFAVACGSGSSFRIRNQVSLLPTFKGELKIYPAIDRARPGKEAFKNPCARRVISRQKHHNI